MTIKTAWAQEWLSRPNLVEGFSLHRCLSLVPASVPGIPLLKASEPIEVEVGPNEKYDGTFHYGTVLDGRTMVNPPEAVKLLLESGMSWDAILDVSDGTWNLSTHEGRFHPKDPTQDCTLTSLERWKNLEYGSFQPEVKYRDVGELSKRIRKGRGRGLVRIGRTGNEHESRSMEESGWYAHVHCFFARPSYEDLVNELFVLRVMVS